VEKSVSRIRDTFLDDLAKIGALYRPDDQTDSVWWSGISSRSGRCRSSYQFPKAAVVLKPVRDYSVNSGDDLLDQSFTLIR
jgi:hypothetical protein